ncbi:ATP-binding cassette domain-containing protein [Conexibacter stalactiti]|uniref:ATP-binding cassette domain-containing protein n=1 Tax=Conexibacter stalactiti TaxID=1940611 RepID=A0ABU4HL90_9ACTN|nr:ATP-binding cassette domain-containing protein [Conexibacter stalactiti]MDW5593467.1 ATP-binding cassette domain-containing protein [Conexibacter stalactiti]MEC5034108.1 ATP-binding cassette domain-containing protein [Conexibacter stalactiti]
MLLSLERATTHRALDTESGQGVVDVTLAVDRGGFVGVWGVRRSGKTALLRLAAGLERPSDGSVRIDGRDTSGMSEAERGRLRLTTIGLVDQTEPHNREVALEDLVALPMLSATRRREAHRRALEVLSYVDLGDRAKVRWCELSSSERTLARTARAIVRRPALLLVDEPALDLGALQEERVVQLLRRLVQELGVGVLMASASMSALHPARQLFVLNEGRLTVLNSRTGGTIVPFPASN